MKNLGIKFKLSQLSVIEHKTLAISNYLLSHTMLILMVGINIPNGHATYDTRWYPLRVVMTTAARGILNADLMSVFDCSACEHMRAQVQSCRTQ